MTHYLGHLGSEAKEKSIAGAMVISMPYELFRSKETIEAPLTHMTAGTYLILKTRGLYRRSKGILLINFIITRYRLDIEKFSTLIRIDFHLTWIMASRWNELPALESY